MATKFGGVSKIIYFCTINGRCFLLATAVAQDGLKSEGAKEIKEDVCDGISGRKRYPNRVSAMAEEGVGDG